MTPVVTKQALMDTALELIWNSHYEKVGIAEICEKAGVTKGAFYHYFTSKADLFVKACAMEWEQKSLLLDELLSPRYTALEQLNNVISLILDKQIRQCPDGETYITGSPVFTAGAQAGCGCTEVQKVAITMSDNSAKYFTALVRNLSSEGYLVEKADESVLGRLMEQFIQGIVMSGRIRQDVDRLRHDLREGLYRLLNLKSEFRTPVDSGNDSPEGELALATG